MVSEQPTRKVVKQLKAAGFEPVNAEGSHTRWRHPSGPQVSIPDGHRTISPGVYRQVLAAIKNAEEASK